MKDSEAPLNNVNQIDNQPSQRAPDDLLNDGSRPKPKQVFKPLKMAAEFSEQLKHQRRKLQQLTKEILELANELDAARKTAEQLKEKATRRVSSFPDHRSHEPAPKKDQRTKPEMDSDKAKASAARK